MRVFRRPIHAGFAMVAFGAMFIAGCGHQAARVSAPLAPAHIGSTETGVASWYGVPYDGRRAASGEVYDMRQLTAAHRRLPFETWVEVTNLSNGKQVDVRINDRGPFVNGRILDLSQAAAGDIDMLRAGTARVRLKVIPPPRTPLREPPREPVEIAATPAAPASAPTTPAAVPPVANAEPIVTGPTVTAPPLMTTTPAAERAVTTSATTLATTLATTAPPTGIYAVQAGAFSDPARAESLRAALGALLGEARVAPSSGRTPPLWRVIVGRKMTRDQAAELAIRVRHEAGTAIVVPDPASASAPNN